MRLKLHPDCLCDAVTRIEVDVRRSKPGRLSLHYILAGNMAGLRLPMPAPPLRTDGLWQHTCFELFAREPSAAAYLECNFSPSTQWAAYRFEACRSGMTDADIAPPAIETRRGDDRFELLAAIEMPDGPILLALSAVIEETNGRKSYWALAHPGAKPDFHHPASFVHELP